MFHVEEKWKEVLKWKNLAKPLTLKLVTTLNQSTESDDSIAEESCEDWKTTSYVDIKKNFMKNLMAHLKVVTDEVCDRGIEEWTSLQEHFKINIKKLLSVLFQITSYGYNSFY